MHIILDIYVIGNSRLVGPGRLGKEFADWSALRKDHGAADGCFDFLGKVDVQGAEDRGVEVFDGVGIGDVFRFVRGFFVGLG